MAKSEPKRSRRKAKVRKPEWNYEDDVALVAWLDYCISRELGFKDTAVDQLKEKRGKKCLWKHIDNRLQSIWNRCGSDTSKSRGDIYREGTACLGRLSEEEKEDIAEALQLLPAGTLRDDVPANRVTSVHHRLRSAARTVAPEPQRRPSRDSEREPTSRVHTREGTLLLDNTSSHSVAAAKPAPRTVADKGHEKAAQVRL